MKELTLSEGFVENINNLIRSREIVNVNDVTMDELLDVVHVDLYVFGPLMMD